MSFKELTRSKSDRMVSGVCGGIARAYRLDTVIVRGVFVVLALANIGVAAIAYVMAIIFLPEEDPMPAGGTTRPGWRYDPWTGESLARPLNDDVVVDTAPINAGGEAETSTSQISDAQTPPRNRPTDDEV
ncbi:MAG: PspC domain-containing protein [Chloroflexi bacterium]|nr:MAG: PspC domain-containing protein [Chloroflexota bacterium]RLT33808.1 MAG: PspC domain-containing protein [Chloroflexota bacterium]